MTDDRRCRRASVSAARLVIVLGVLVPAGVVAQVQLPSIGQSTPVLTPTGPNAKPSAASTTPTVQPDGFLLCLMQTIVDRNTTTSAQCLACHDGSKNQVSPDGSSYPIPDARQGHKFDIEYFSTNDSEYRRDPTGYNAAVVLLGGKTITCLTCHDSKSTLLYHLAAPTSGPLEKRMCAACHVR